MFLTNHTLTGTLVGITLGPALALPVGFLSHLALDALPHFGHPKLDLRVNPGFSLAVVDSLASLGVFVGMLMLFPDRGLDIALGVFGATLPDLLYIPRNYLGWVPSKAFAALHKKIQWSESPPGVLTEFIWGALMLKILLG